MQGLKTEGREKMKSLDILGKRSEDNKFINVDALGGQLYLLKTVIRYDHPLWFVCQNEVDELFLFNEMKDEESLLEWGVINVDTESLDKFLKGELSFRELYLTCGDNYLVVAASYKKSAYFDEPSEIFIDNDKYSSKSYKELLEFYNDDRKLRYYLYDDIGESND